MLKNWREKISKIQNKEIELKKEKKESIVQKENKDKRYEKTFFVRNDAPLAALVGAERQRPQL